MIKKHYLNGVLVEFTVDGVSQLDSSKLPLISKFLPRPCIGCGKKVQNLDAKSQTNDSPQT